MKDITSLNLVTSCVCCSCLNRGGDIVWQVSYFEVPVLMCVIAESRLLIDRDRLRGKGKLSQGRSSTTTCTREKEGQWGIMITDKI